MAELAFADATARGLYDVSDDEFRKEQWFTQLDTGLVYAATAAGIGNWKVVSGPQAARAETAAPSAGSLPIAGGTMTGDITMGAHKITVPTPTATGDATPKTYVDTADALKLAITSFKVPVTVVDSIDLIGGNGAIVRWASPLAGTLTLFKCVIDGALTTANAVLTGKIGATGITNGVITCTQAGSAAGSVFSASPSALNVLAVGDVLSFTCSGAQDAAKFGKITAMITPA